MPDALGDLTELIRRGLSDSEAKARPLLEALFGSRYHKRYLDTGMIRDAFGLAGAGAVGGGDAWGQDRRRDRDAAEEVVDLGRLPHPVDGSDTFALPENLFVLATPRTTPWSSSPATPTSWPLARPN